MEGKAKSLMPFDRCPVDGQMPSPTYCKECVNFVGTRLIEHNQMPYTAILCSNKPRPKLQDVHEKILKMYAGIEPYSTRYPFREIAYNLNLCPATITYHKNRAINILIDQQYIKKSQMKNRLLLIAAIKSYYSVNIVTKPIVISTVTSKTTDERFCDIIKMVNDMSKKIENLGEYVRKLPGCELLNEK